MINKVSMLNFGRLYREAEIAINGLEISFRLHLDSLEDLDDNTFWSMLDEFKKEIDRTISSRMKDPTVNDANIKLASHRFGCGYFFGGKGEYETLLRFVATYSRKKNKLYKPLFDVIQGFGDDSYGDILDSFPLLGRKRYEAALEGWIEGDSDAQYQGENYVEMGLESEAFKFFRSYCRFEADEIETGELGGENVYYKTERQIYKTMGLSSDS